MLLLWMGSCKKLVNFSFSPKHFILSSHIVWYVYFTFEADCFSPFSIFCRFFHTSLLCGFFFTFFSCRFFFVGMFVGSALRHFFVSLFLVPSDSFLCMSHFGAFQCALSGSVFQPIRICQHHFDMQNIRKTNVKPMKTEHASILSNVLHFPPQFDIGQAQKHISKIDNTAIPSIAARRILWFSKSIIL